MAMMTATASAARTPSVDADGAQVQADRQPRQIGASATVEGAVTPRFRLKSGDRVR